MDNRDPNWIAIINSDPNVYTTENAWFRVRPLCALSVRCPVGGGGAAVLRGEKLDSGGRIRTPAPTLSSRVRGLEEEKGWAKVRTHPAHHHLEWVGEVADNQEDEMKRREASRVGVQIRAGAREGGGCLSPTPKLPYNAVRKHAMHLLSSPDPWPKRCGKAVRATRTFHLHS